ncbi:serine protease Do [Staphylococcus hominis]
MTEYNQYYQSSDYQHSRPPKSKFPWFRIIIIALLAGIIGALIVLGINRFMNGEDSNSGGSQVQQATNDKGGNILDGKSDKYKSVNAMIKDVSPAIVGVINMQKATSFDDLLQGKSSKAQEAGIGSGVIYQINNNSAYIVTNNHVIDGASQIKVQLHNGKQVEAKLVGKDAVSDIAVLKIDSQKGIKAMKFANSSKVQTGDSVFAMGNPLGLEFANSVTSGIISANERTIESNTTSGGTKVNVLQTDAAINPGNSGGALVDINGNLVGINSMKIAADQVEGIGFAIPSNEVRVTIEQLVKHGKVERPSIGIGLLNLSDIPDSYKKELKTERDTGVYVAKVSHSSELKVGDIITKVDSKKVDDDTDLRTYLYQNKKPGETVKLTVIRDGKTQDVSVTLKNQKSTSTQSFSSEDNNSQFIR